MGWSPDNRVFYFTDTIRKVIYAYDFDLQSGTITNRRKFVESANEAGVPDGLTVDSQGFVWSVRCGGGNIVRYDPSGCVERVITLPVSHPTSCIFGGTELNELYITTSRMLVPEEHRMQQPLAGDLFRLRIDIRGLPVSEFQD